MKTIGKVMHTIGIIWSSVMTVLAIEGWIVSLFFGYDYYQRKHKKFKKYSCDEGNE